ncbi:MAG: hypothetical protein RLZZ623_2827, partial [Actinomycetota bacterium]
MRRPLVVLTLPLVLLAAACTTNDSPVAMESNANSAVTTTSAGTEPGTTSPTASTAPTTD